MCGRTSLSLHKDQVLCACSYKPMGSNKYVQPVWLDEHNAGNTFTPSYNIAPSNVTPVLVSSSKYGNASQNERLVKPMMWGIIPPWHKGDYKAHNMSTNNCRLENIQTSKLYNPILRNGGRCIIIAEGFYEWQTTDKSSKLKQPYYIYSQHNGGAKIDKPQIGEEFNEECGWQGPRLLHMAGLYNVWQHDGVIIYAYSVITLASNSTLDWLHHRMPAIMDTQEQIKAWLDIDNVSADMALTCIQPVTMLSWHRVSSIVNNSRNKSADCNKQLQVQHQNKKQQTTLNLWFSKAEKRRSIIENESSPNCKKIKKDSL